MNKQRRAISIVSITLALINDYSDDWDHSICCSNFRYACYG